MNSVWKLNRLRVRQKGFGTEGGVFIHAAQQINWENARDDIVKYLYWKKHDIGKRKRVVALHAVQSQGRHRQKMVRSHAARRGNDDAKRAKNENRQGGLCG